MHTELPSKNLLDDKWDQFLKRGFDIVVSLCFLCLVFPFLLLLVFFWHLLL